MSDTAGDSAREIPRPAAEVMFNRFMGPLLTLGFGPGYMYLLKVPGRKSGRIFTVPVNLMAHAGAEYIVAPRGNVQWVRNLRVAERFELRRGLRRIRASATEVEDADKPPLLKEYLARYAAATGQFFPLAADASESAFAGIAANYPVFCVARL